MTGFPARVGRNSYGPDPVNERPVRNPQKQMDGETTGRLMFWTLGAAGLMLPIARFRFQYVDSALTLISHKEAFQPRGGDPPTVTHSATGAFVFSYAATYQDETGAPVELVLDGGGAFGQGATLRNGTVTIDEGGHSGIVRCFDDAGDLADPYTGMLVVLW